MPAPPDTEWVPVQQAPSDTEWVPTGDQPPLDQGFPSAHWRGQETVGIAELAGKGIANLGLGAVSGAKDLGRFMAGLPKTSPVFQPLQLGPAGQQVAGQIGAAARGLGRLSDIESQIDPLAMGGRIAAQAGAAAYRQLPEGFRQRLERVGGDIGQMAAAAPLVGGAARVAEMAGPAARGVADVARGIGRALPPVEKETIARELFTETADTRRAHAMGLRVLGDRPWAKAMAGTTARQTIVNMNNAAGVAVIKRLSGIPDAEVLSVSPENNTFHAARESPLHVYGRIVHHMDTAPLGPERANAVHGAVSAASDAEARTRLAPMAEELTRGPLPPRDVATRLSELRRDGFKLIASKSAVDNQVGRGFLSFADALEDHMADQIATHPEMATSIEQFRDARRALALNLTGEDVFLGGQLDLRKLGRMYRAAPDRFQDPDMRALADFANRHSASVGTVIEGEDTAIREMVKGRLNILEPATYARLVHGIDYVPGLRRLGPTAALTRGAGPAAARRVVHRNAARFDPPEWYRQYEAGREREWLSRQTTVPQPDLGVPGVRPPPRERLQLQPPPGRVTEPFQATMGLPQGPPPRPTLELAPPPGQVVEIMQYHLNPLGPGRGRAVWEEQQRLFQRLQAPRVPGRPIGGIDPNAPGGGVPAEMPVPFAGPQPAEGQLPLRLQEFARGRYSDMEQP